MSFRKGYFRILAAIAFAVAAFLTSEAWARDRAQVVRPQRYYYSQPQQRVYVNRPHYRYNSYRSPIYYHRTYSYPTYYYPRVSYPRVYVPRYYVPTYRYVPPVVYIPSYYYMYPSYSVTYGCGIVY